MIKDGMWLEDNAHYEYYLNRTKALSDAFSAAHEELFNPLIVRMLSILNESKPPRHS